MFLFPFMRVSFGALAISGLSCGPMNGFGVSFLSNHFCVHLDDCIVKGEDFAFEFAARRCATAA